MTRREIAALCCRIMALMTLAWSAMYFIGALSMFGSAITTSSQFGMTDNPYFFGAKTSGSVASFLLLCSMGLGWKSETISRWMAAEDPSPVTGPELSAAALMPVACTGVGLFAVTRALPTFFRLSAVLASNQLTLGEIWADDGWKVSLIADFLLLAWGVWLIFGARGLLRIVTWARSTGLSQELSKDDSSPPQELPHDDGSSPDVTRPRK